MSYPILETKLFTPEMHHNHVARRDLVEKLISGVDRNNKLTLVSAPAGYGKTTLVIEFLKTTQMRHGWISLDEEDNDLSQFLLYFLEALKRAGVSIGSDTERMVSDIKLSSTQGTMALIINDIVKFSEKVIIVLDDFHLINSHKVIDVVKFIIEHQPRNFHLIIITREDLHFPFAQLRVQGKIIEIRTKDLCFNLYETEKLLNYILNFKLSNEAIKAIALRTEGWAAGLQLAGLSLGGCEEHQIDEFIELFTDTNKYTIDYLLEEVISHQGEDVREFLRKTSILHRMNGSLCNRITGRNNSQKLLGDLDKANLFLIALDSKREWYRYHHLFADSLRTELTKEEEQELQRKAAIWFHENCFRQEAINYALKSGDKSLSLKLIEESTEQSFKNAQLQNLLKWMESIPEDMIKNSEILSVRKAWALYLTGKTVETMDYINSLGEDFIKKATPHNKGLILSLRALRERQLGNNSSEALAQEALKYLEPWDPIARISTMNTLGRSQEGLGKTAEAVETFRKSYKEGIRIGYTFITTISLTYLGKSLNSMGKGKEALNLYTSYIEGMTKEFGKPLPFVGLIYIALAELYYENNELNKAKEYITQGMELCESISYGWIESIGLLHNRIQLAMDERDNGYLDKEIKTLKCKTIDKATIKGEVQLEKLSKRELEILRLIVKGMSNNEISKTLYISINTTQWHISHIYSKLDVRSRTQAIIKAQELGII